MRIHRRSDVRRALGVFFVSACACLVASCCGIESIRTESLPDATVGQAYSFEMEHNCTGETALETEDWRIVGGALPSGIRMSGNGELAGTPLAPGTARFSVQLASSGTAVFTIRAVREFSLTVNPRQSAAQSMNAQQRVAAGRL